MAYLHPNENATSQDRPTFKADVQCGCGGSGIWFGMECDWCNGAGFVNKLIYASCGHAVADEECSNNDCQEEERLQALLKDTHHLEDAMWRAVA